MGTIKKHPSWEDILFEGRNKSYGAYELRLNYERRIVRSLGISLTALLTLFFISYFSRENKRTSINRVVNTAVIFSEPYKAEIVPASSPVSRPQQRFQKIPKQVFSAAFIPVRDSIEPLIQTDSSSSLHTDTISVPSAGIRGLKRDTVSANQFTGSGFAPFSMAAVDNVPEFPGGMDKFYSYLTDNIRYTNDARENGFSGKLFISFVVDSLGLISEIEIMSKVGYGMDEVVRKVLSSSPSWQPGKVKGIPVKTRMMLPLSFNLVR